MKRLNSLLLIVTLLFTISNTNITFAAEKNSNEYLPIGNFEISSRDVEESVISFLNSEETEFIMTKDFITSDESVGNEITIKITRLESDVSVLATETINFALSGRYYFKSSDTTISNYGIHGSAEYTGYSLKNINWDKYHDVTSKYSATYSGTATASTEDLTKGKKLIGGFSLKNTKTNTWSDDAEISISIYYDGSWATKGNYGAIHVD